MTDPLVAERQDSTTASSGVPILESVDETKKAIESGDWAAGVMGAVGAGLWMHSGWRWTRSVPSWLPVWVG